MGRIRTQEITITKSGNAGFSDNFIFPRLIRHSQTIIMLMWSKIVIKSHDSCLDQMADKVSAFPYDLQNLYERTKNIDIQVFKIDDCKLSYYPNSQG